MKKAHVNRISMSDCEKPKSDESKFVENDLYCLDSKYVGLSREDSGSSITFTVYTDKFTDKLVGVVSV